MQLNACNFTEKLKMNFTHEIEEQRGSCEESRFPITVIYSVSLKKNCEHKLKVKTYIGIKVNNQECISFFKLLPFPFDAIIR